MSLDIEVSGLRVDYGRTTAVDDLTFSLAAGKIYGLLGRNGAGKTSLLSVLSAFRRQSGGTVHVGGEDPFENAALTRQIAFIREQADVFGLDRVQDVMTLGGRCGRTGARRWPTHCWSGFALPRRKRINALSLGMKSALRVTIGIAARTPLTIFDEAYLGMDAPSRYAFYEELLNDYMEFPRTIILSTHLIEEFGSMFEEVLILDKGRLVVRDSADSLRSRGASVTGPADAVDAFVADDKVLSEQRLGGTKSATIYGEIGGDRRLAAKRAGLELGPVALQDLFIHLTEPTKESR
jgi:ABC-2 type transport system ATP-binding protein